MPGGAGGRRRWRSRSREAAAASGSGTGGARLKPIGSFEDPVFVAGTRAFPRLLFVVERPGVIRALRRGRTLKRPFLDISGLVSTNHSERGLLSVAFPPDYLTSRRFYVYYTDHDGNLCIDEFKRNRAHPARAVPSSRRRVISIPHSDLPQPQRRPAPVPRP